MPRPGLLVILTGPNQGRTFFIPLDKTISIGSAFDAWASLPHDLHLSDYHCTLHYDGEYFHLTDLNSQQGTQVHGIDIATIGSVPLPVGECFTAGDSTLQVQLWPPEVLRTLSEQSEPLLAVIDASRDESIWPLLSRSKAYYSCLFEGTRAQSLAAWAPYLVSLSPSSALLKSLVQAGWGKHWGVYLTSLAPFETILAHLRQWLWVQIETGEKLYFRFYDPRTLRVFLPTLTLAEQQRFFGPIRSYLMEDELPEHIMKWTPESVLEKWPSLGKQLLAWHPSDKKSVFNLRQEQIAVFHRQIEQDLLRQIMQQLREKHPTKIEALSNEELRSQVYDGINRAKRYGLMDPASLATFVVLRFEIAFRFDEQVNIQRALSNEKVPLHARITWMLKGTSEADWLEAKQNHNERRR
ncbi:MAG: DUF4123 domain-containing protein [Thioploca sp.]|nr:DUF4123 domain-containing protein [Thioploca sp.]